MEAGYLGAGLASVIIEEVGGNALNRISEGVLRAKCIDSEVGKTNVSGESTGNQFTIIDWIVFFVIASIIVFTGLRVSRTKKDGQKTTSEYFLAGRSLPGGQFQLKIELIRPGSPGENPPGVSTSFSLLPKVHSGQGITNPSPSWDF